MSKDEYKITYERRFDSGHPWQVMNESNPAEWGELEAQAVASYVEAIGDTRNIEIVRRTVTDWEKVERRDIDD